MNCPICDNTEHEKLYHLCDNMRIMGGAFPDSKSDLVACSRCGLIYMDTAATQTDFLAYYRHGAVAPKYYDMFGQEATNDYYRHIVEILQPYISADSKILDVAGAWGELGKYFVDAGYSHVTVVDPNEDCLATAKEKGVQTVCASSIDMGDALIDIYDVVLLNHSLEHILDVKSTMKQIGKVLSPNGYLFIEVPDAAHYADENQAPFNFFTYEHVLHLTQNDLINIAGRYGFRILSMAEYYKEVSHYPSIYAILQKSDEPRQEHISWSATGKKGIEKYIGKSKAALDVFIKELSDRKEPLILWGIGASTTILLGAFAECNVVMLVDRNPMRQGLDFQVGGRMLLVEPPEKVGDNGTIVILSIPYRDSIERQIRELGKTNRIISLK